MEEKDLDFEKAKKLPDLRLRSSRSDRVPGRGMKSPRCASALPFGGRRASLAVLAVVPLSVGKPGIPAQPCVEGWGTFPGLLPDRSTQDQ